jgi:hypothetical protein
MTAPTNLPTKNTDNDHEASRLVDVARAHLWPFSTGPPSLALLTLTHCF